MQPYLPHSVTAIRSKGGMFLLGACVSTSLLRALFYTPSCWCSSWPVTERRAHTCSLMWESTQVWSALQNSFMKWEMICLFTLVQIFLSSFSERLLLGLKLITVTARDQRQIYTTAGHIPVVWRNGTFKCMECEGKTHRQHWNCDGYMRICLLAWGANRFTFSGISKYCEQCWLLNGPIFLMIILE